MDRLVKSKVSSAEIQSRWGIPDWTRAENYPEKMTDLEWRWEFLRRHPDYRNAWLEWRGKRRNKWPLPVMGEGADITYVLTDNMDEIRTRFGVSVLYDPRVSMSEDVISRAGIFYTRPVSVDHESLVRLGAALAARHDSVEEAIRRVHQDSDGFVDYRFNITEPLEPQLKKARAYLSLEQSERHGKKNAYRPSRELWPLYLRVLDARECGASWTTIGKGLWGSDTTRDKARRTYECAVGVRDNFPL